MPTLQQLAAKHDKETAALVRAALREQGGNTSRVASLLGIPRTNLLRLIARLGLDDLAAHKEGRPPNAEE